MPSFLRWIYSVSTKSENLHKLNWKVTTLSMVLLIHVSWRFYAHELVSNSDIQFWSVYLTPCISHLYFNKTPSQGASVSINLLILLPNITDLDFVATRGIRVSQTYLVCVNNAVLRKTNNMENCATGLPLSSRCYSVHLNSFLYNFVTITFLVDDRYEIYIASIFIIPPPHRIMGAYCFCTVCPFVYLTVVNFNLRYNFWTVWNRDFIFGMQTLLMMPFQMTPRSMTLTLTFVLKIAFLDFVAAGA